MNWKINKPSRFIGIVGLLTALFLGVVLTQQANALCATHREGLG
jgi:hypothetical protein